MSRIGSWPISIPGNVEVNITQNNVVEVKGPKGELRQAVNPAIKIKIEDNTVYFERTSDKKRYKALHGLYRALVNNMINGVSEGYKRTLMVAGVGFKAQNNGQILELSIGYSHNIFLEIPKEIKIETVTERGKNPKIILESYDKQLLGQVVAKIKSLRKPEPYKGKGIYLEGEAIRRKAGKTAAAAK